MKPSLDLTRDTITIATKDGAKETQTVKLPGTHGETYQSKGLLMS
jgi:VCBS repeat-containing protein